MDSDGVVPEAIVVACGAAAGGERSKAWGDGLVNTAARSVCIVGAGGARPPLPRGAP